MVAHRAEFWSRMIQRLDIAFARPPETILDDAGGPEHPRWLPGARLNIVDSCFKASACTIAVAIGREGSDAIETVTYGELEALANRDANGLVAHDLAPGYGIALYMPMTLECVAAYLGVIRAGSFVISIADSFAAHELARRLEIGGAQAIVTVAGGPPGPGALDERTCTTDGSGSSSLCGEWQDPDFDPDEHAFYYARLLERMSPPNEVGISATFSVS